MRHSTLTYQSRIVGAAVLVIGALVALSVFWTARERNPGASYFTLSPDVQGVETGSIVTLNGYEIGHVTGVELKTQADGSTPGAADPMFRIDFRILVPVTFPRATTGLSTESVNPVVPARLVVEQLPSVPSSDTEGTPRAQGTSAKTVPCDADPAETSDLIPPGGCVPMIARTADDQPGLGGLLELARSILGQVRDETLPAFKDTLQRYREMATEAEKAVDQFSKLAEEARDSNERFASMLNEDPGGLLALPGSLEDAVTRVADVSEQLHGDVLLRVDRMVAPETIAALARAVADLEQLIATSSRQTQATLENIATITQSLNRITWQLERDPVGFLRGSGRGTR
jgi:ABC-type transporter Mla subunit MlaD